MDKQLNFPFFHSHNSYDLTLSQTEEVINHIAQRVGAQTKDLYLTKLAIGFTIPIDRDPLQVIGQYKFHKGKPLTPLQKKG